MQAKTVPNVFTVKTNLSLQKTTLRLRYGLNTYMFSYWDCIIC